MILFLNKHKNKNILLLFIYGFLFGSILEYILGYILESMYSIRFWDYGYTKINLNGRICLQFSIYWGLLSIIILKLIKPIIDKFIDKIKINVLEIFIFVFLVIDCIFTIWGIRTYENRVVYNKINNTSENIIIRFINDFENNYFTNDRMSKTFPNLRIKDENGNEIWIRSLIHNESNNSKN